VAKKCTGASQTPGTDIDQPGHRVSGIPVSRAPPPATGS
jgi:hypothetical protein